MPVKPKTYANRGEKIIDFAIGFLGLTVINLVGVGLLGLGAYVGASGSQPTWVAQAISFSLVILSGLWLLLNLAGIVGLAFTRSWMALGALSAIGLALLAGLCVGVLMAGTCFLVLRV